jgi:predicted nucleic acid-binding protein
MSGFLLDTNIPSELVRTLPEPKVQAWVAAQEIGTLHLSVVSIGELHKGFTIMPEGRRRAQLQDWLTSALVPLFADRVLPVTHAIAERWVSWTAFVN